MFLIEQDVYELQKKADYIKKTTKILQDNFNSDIPNSVEGLVSLFTLYHMDVM